MAEPHNKWTACLIIGMVDIFTWIPLTLFGLFLFFGPIFSIDLDLSHSTALILNAMLSLMFFFQHSLMIRKNFHARLEKRISPIYHRAIFASISGLTLSLMLILWQPSHINIVTFTGFFRWLLRATFVLSIFGFAWAGLALKGLDTTGEKSIKRYLHNEKEPDPEFTSSGPYQWVRHPLYFFTLLMLWSCPDIPSDRLLLNILWSGWIAVGAHLEEKDLIEVFGDAYRQYRNQVPMLIPFPFRKANNI